MGSHVSLHGSVHHGMERGAEDDGVGGKTEPRKARAATRGEGVPKGIGVMRPCSWFSLGVDYRGAMYWLKNGRENKRCGAKLGREPACLRSSSSKNCLEYQQWKSRVRE